MNALKLSPPMHCGDTPPLSTLILLGLCCRAAQIKPAAPFSVHRHPSSDLQSQLSAFPISAFQAGSQLPALALSVHGSKSALICGKPPFSCVLFKKRTDFIPVSYRFHTGFVPVSYRFRTDFTPDIPILYRFSSAPSSTPCPIPRQFALRTSLFALPCWTLGAWMFSSVRTSPRDSAAPKSHEGGFGLLTFAIGSWSLDFGCSSPSSVLRPPVQNYDQPSRLLPPRGVEKVM